MSRSSDAPAAPLGTIHYVYDLDGHLIAEADGATGATLREYLWLPANDNTSGTGNDTLAEAMGLAANDNQAVDLPLAVIDGVNTATKTTSYIHTDHLGRPTRMTSATKATVWQATWTPWGEPQAISGTVTQNLRFPGQYFQIETGLAYNWHRHYDPVTGRYTQPDPLRFVDGPSIYAYAGNSPFMNTDREGQNLARYIGGGLGGGLFGMGYAWWKFGNCLSAKDYAKAFGIGAAHGMAAQFGAEKGIKLGKSKLFRRFLADESGGIKWTFGANKSAEKWREQMERRGWTTGQIDEAVSAGKQFPAPKNLNPRNGATRFENPQTKRSVVIDDKTGEVLHVGGDGFKY